MGGHRLGGCRLERSLFSKRASRSHESPFVSGNLRFAAVSQHSFRAGIRGTSCGSPSTSTRSTRWVEGVMWMLKVESFRKGQCCKKDATISVEDLQEVDLLGRWRRKTVKQNEKCNGKLGTQSFGSMRQEWPSDRVGSGMSWFGWALPPGIRLMLSFAFPITRLLHFYDL